MLVLVGCRAGPSRPSCKPLGDRAVHVCSHLPLALAALRKPCLFQEGSCSTRLGTCLSNDPRGGKGFTWASPSRIPTGPFTAATSRLSQIDATAIMMWRLLRCSFTVRGCRHQHYRADGCHRSVFSKGYTSHSCMTASSSQAWSSIALFLAS